MSIYQGPPLSAGRVSLIPPDPVVLSALLPEADLTEQQKGWLDRAGTDRSVLYFCIDHGGRLIGQILLHDINEQASEALVGYDLFQPDDRGRGFGSAALTALCDYAFAERGLKRLIAITSLDNTASRRTAEKAGFREVGPAREGPELVVYERAAPLSP